MTKVQHAGATRAAAAAAAAAPRPPAANAVVEPPIRLGRFHELWVDHVKRLVRVRCSAVPGDHSPETVQALREGEGVVERVVALWRGLGYAVDD